MKYLIIFVCLFICNFCFADYNQPDAFFYDNPLYYSYHTSFEPNPIVMHPKRYINGLGHEFPIIFSVAGTYWKGGAWGSKNGFDNYYGNVYFTSSIYQFDKDGNVPIPEPSTLLIFSIAVIFLKKG